MAMQTSTIMTTRRAILNAWKAAVGTDRITGLELQTVQSVLADAHVFNISKLLRNLYGEPLTARALKLGDTNIVSQALHWRDWISTDRRPDTLWKHKVDIAKHFQEPLWIPLCATANPDELPAVVLTVDGALAFEEEYLPRVVTGEHRDAPLEAKTALAIAARTFVLRAMCDHPALGRTAPIKNGTSFQVFSRGATPEAVAAVERSRGYVMRYGGQLILANYVAGSPWIGEGQPRYDPPSDGEPIPSEKWVTYNVGRIGADVNPTGLALKSHPANRGCMSQNGASWLAKHGWNCWAILRYFYGDDVEFHRIGPPEAESSKGFGLGIAALVLLGLVAGSE